MNETEIIMSTRIPAYHVVPCGVYRQRDADPGPSDANSGSCKHGGGFDSRSGA